MYDKVSYSIIPYQCGLRCSNCTYKGRCIITSSSPFAYILEAIYNNSPRITEHEIKMILSLLKLFPKEVEIALAIHTDCNILNAIEILEKALEEDFTLRVHKNSSRGVMLP